MIGTCGLWLFAAISSFQSNRTINNEPATEAARFERLKSKPLLATEWLSIADYYHSIENNTARDAALAVAEKLSTNRAILLAHVWKRQLDWKLYYDSRKVAARLVDIAPQLNYPVFDAMTRFTGINNYVNNVLTGNSQSRLHTKESQVNTIISGAIASDNVNAVRSIWLSLNEKLKTTVAKSRYMPTHYTALLRKGGFNAIEAIGNDSGYAVKYLGRRVELSFQQNDANNPFCWMSNSSMLSEPNVNDQGLTVTLSSSSGNQNSGLRCFLPVTATQESSVSVSSTWSYEYEPQKNGTPGSSEKSTLLIRPITKGEPYHSNFLRTIKAGTWNREVIQKHLTIDQHTIGLDFYIELPYPGNSLTVGAFSIDNFIISPSTD